jgi:hypothetical protein
MSVRAIDIARVRLRNERLIGAPFRRAADAVTWLCAVQAQDYAGAKWGIGQRVRNCADADVQDAYTRGAILRTHVLRPTWHFVTPDDIRWMLALTAARVKQAMSYYDRQLELDAAAFRKSNRTIERALLRGGHLTRAESAKELTAAGLGGTAQRISHMMMRAELDAVVCSGEMPGKQHTYALLDARAPDARVLGRDEALAELSLRYFTSHGPALAQDFAWWSGLTVADAKRGIEMNRAALEQREVHGKTYWYAPLSAPLKVAEPTIHLLPNYDEYYIAYKDHAASYRGETPQGMEALYEVLSRHIMSLNGYVAGGWSPRSEKDGVRIEIRLIEPLTRPQRAALEAEAQRYGVFIGQPVRVVEVP